MGIGNQSARQLAFVEHPDALLDPIKAALDVGYSEGSAQSNAYRLRQKYLPDLMSRMAVRLDKMGVTDERLKSEYFALALSNVVEFFERKDIQVKNADGELVTKTITVMKDVLDLPDHAQRAIKKLEFDVYIDADGASHTYVSKFDLHPKIDALRDLMKMRGHFNDVLMAQRLNTGEAPPVNPLDEMTIEELEDIAKIHEAASKRAAEKAGKARDDQAIEGSGEVSRSSRALVRRDDGQRLTPRKRPKRDECEDEF